MFFATLTAFGLRALPAVPVFVGGAALLAALVVAAGLVRWRWGVWLGWALQGVLIATGILLPIMFAIGAGFAAIWVFCFVKGRQLDRAKPTSTPTPAQDTPTPTQEETP